MSSLPSSRLSELVLFLKDIGRHLNFVESGTYLGDSAEWASHHFKRIVTIELSKTLFDMTSEKLRNLKNIEFRQGDSRNIIGQVVPTLTGPSIFWLDGHYSCGNTAGEEHECPILEELQSLKHIGVDDVVLIDDAHLFVKPAPVPLKCEHWPSITDVIDLLKKINCSFYITIIENAIVAVPASMKPSFVDYISTRPAEQDTDTHDNHPPAVRLNQAVHESHSMTNQFVSRSIAVLKSCWPSGWLSNSDSEAIIAALRSRASELPLQSIQNFNQENRDRWIAIKAQSVQAGASVLDVGAGTCRYRKDFSHCHYKTHDFKRYEGFRNNKEGQYGEIDHISDITEIPVPDKSYDVVLCTEVLEHVPEPITALQEMARILKPHGRLLITAPLGSGLHQTPYHFYGGFTPDWYRHFCPKSGLSVIEITPNGGFFKLLAQECARVAWTMPQHEHVHGKNKDMIGTVFGEVLPRYLFALEERCMIDQFTVGYHVEAKKIN